MAVFSDLFLPDSLVLRSERSPDSQALTTIFQNLSVILEPTPAVSQPGHGLTDPPLIATRMATVFAPIGGDDPQVTINVKLQGKVDIEPHARAVLFSRLAGTTFVDDLGPFSGGDFEFFHSANLSPQNGFLASVILLIDRDWVDKKVPLAMASLNFMELTFP